MERRTFLSVSSLIGLSPITGQLCEAVHGSENELAEKMADNVYTRMLGIRPHLPAHEHVTRLGGNRLRAEVIEAMVEANEFYVDMHELFRKAGTRIAELIGAEDAIVTAGAFSGMIIAAAACLSGTDPERISALPKVTWDRNECLIQSGHRFHYDRAYRCAGMEIVEATSREEMKQSVTGKTAMIAGIAIVEKQKMFAPPLPIDGVEMHDEEVMLPEELIQLGKQTNVPVIIDFASDIPPATNLTRFVDAGADLVVVSGGKAIGGPQSTGILAGRKDLIAAARLNAYPNDNVGRGMKVGREEVIGLVAALELFVRQDYTVQIARWNRHAHWLADQLQGIDGLSASYSENTMGYGDVELSWDPDIIPLTVDQAKDRLMNREPRLAYLITIRTRLMTDAELALAAEALRDFFQRHSK